MKNQQHIPVSKPSPGEFEATDIGNISICLIPGKRPCAMPPNVKGTFVLQQYGFIAGEVCVASMWPTHQETKNQ